jgi:hypothetical protein
LTSWTLSIGRRGYRLKPHLSRSHVMRLWSQRQVLTRVGYRHPLLVEELLANLGHGFKATPNHRTGHRGRRVGPQEDITDLLAAPGGDIDLAG